MKSGIELFKEERDKQATKYTQEHDDSHNNSELALAAVAYAAPRSVFAVMSSIEHSTECGSVVWRDVFPWSTAVDLRYSLGYKNRHKPGISRVLPEPSTYSLEDRLKLLVTAGALLAAEVDRLQRVSMSLEAMKESMPKQGGARVTLSSVSVECEAVVAGKSIFIDFDKENMKFKVSYVEDGTRAIVLSGLVVSTEGRFELIVSAFSLLSKKDRDEIKAVAGPVIRKLLGG